MSTSTDLDSRSRVGFRYRCMTLGLTRTYSVLSFGASQRTRELGIRIALGGRPRHVVAVLFRRPLMQIALGILIQLGAVRALRIPPIEALRAEL